MIGLKRADVVSRLEKGKVGIPGLDISSDGKVDSRQLIISLFYTIWTDHGLWENRSN